MHHGEPTASHGHGTGSGEERRLSEVTFVGSFAAADFRSPLTLPQVAFVGRSNVGKSSLLNKIVGRRSLAFTSKTPGKTKTLNVYQISTQFYLVDLPGYGYAKVSKSDRTAFSKLISTYLSNRNELAGAVWLLDIRRNPSPEDMAIADKLSQHGTPALIAITKADKVARTHRNRRLSTIAEEIGVAEEQCILTSALSGDGVSDLVDSIRELVREEQQSR